MDGFFEVGMGDQVHLSTGINFQRDNLRILRINGDNRSFGAIINTTTPILRLEDTHQQFEILTLDSIRGMDTLFETEHIFHFNGEDMRNLDSDERMEFFRHA